MPERKRRGPQKCPRCNVNWEGHLCEAVPESKPDPAQEVREAREEFHRRLRIAVTGKQGRERDETAIMQAFADFEAAVRASERAQCVAIAESSCTYRPAVCAKVESRGEFFYSMDSPCEACQACQRMRSGV